MTRTTCPLTVLAVALLAVTLSLAGCASDQGLSANDQPTLDRGNLPIDPEQAVAMGYFPAWSSQVPLQGGQKIEAVRWLGDLLVVVERPSNLITAFDVKTGKVKWAAELGDVLADLYAPIRRGDEIYINTQARLFTLDAKTGEVIRSAPLEATVRTGPTLQDRFALYGAVNGRVFAVNVETGVTKWSYAMPAAVTQPPVPGEVEVFAVDDAGNYAMLNLVTGKLKWRNSTFGPVSAAPAAGLGDVLVASQDRALYSLSRSSGNPTWVYRSQSPLTQGPFVAERVLLQRDPAKGLVALDAFSGSPLWVRQDVSSLKPLALMDGNLLMQATNALVYLNSETGDTIEQAQTDALNNVVVQPQGEALVLVTQTGRLLRLNPL